MAAASAEVRARAVDFLRFLNASPSPFHAVNEARRMLLEADFQEVKEREDWQPRPGGKYFVTRNQSSLVAFALGGKHTPSNGFSIVGAHTDSPCLRVKPISAVTKSGYVSVGVECYGGGLWDTWHDRDLTVAGRVIVRTKEGNLTHRLVHVQRPIIRVPNLCIHLRKADEREKWSFNKETEMIPILATTVKTQLETLAAGGAKRSDDGTPKHHPLLLDILCKELGCEPADIADFELCLADVQPAVLGGALEEFIFGPRLDNLLSTYCGLRALIESQDSLADDTNARVLCLYDHEEIGSNSAHGAESMLTENILRRLSGSSDGKFSFEQAIAQSMLVSADMAHAVHPGFASKHEDNHRPALHGGMVLKSNCNQKYATNSVSGTLLRECALKAGVPIQEFVVRNDSPCGSTIGPILSAGLGLRTVDIGAPQLSMHSIRETCCTSGVSQCIALLHSFYKNYPGINSLLKID